MLDCSYLIEILTPKRATPDRIEETMKSFAEKYRRIISSGSGVTIPDNPMGQPRYSALEAIEYCGLPLEADNTVLNLNTFHLFNSFFNESIIRFLSRKIRLNGTLSIRVGFPNEASTSTLSRLGPKRSPWIMGRILNTHGFTNRAFYMPIGSPNSPSAFLSLENPLMLRKYYSSEKLPSY